MQIFASSAAPSFSIYWKCERNDGIESRYSILIRFDSQESTDTFYQHFRGKQFNSLEEDVCRLLFTLDVQFTGYSGSIDHTQPSAAGPIEQPTCPVCLERLDQDTGGILTTMCNHSFHCSCISNWPDSSCPVCRYCQQQPENSVCCVCQTTENLWMCVICGVVGCGRYKGGHARRHWEETEHYYSLELETQRVWDYSGDNYVHRLIQSKTDGKLVELNSHGSLSKDGCGSCEYSDGGMTDALLNSKVDMIISEYNELLQAQLENQKQYFEKLLQNIKEEAEQEVSDAASKAISQRLQKLQTRFYRCVKEKQFLEDLNENLVKNKDVWSTKITEMEASKNKAWLRLRAACEKLKKVLSANPVAPLNIECLMDEKDVRGVIKREEFEEISIPILERVKRPLEKALSDAGLTVEEVHMVEVVGSASCVPAMIKILTDFFGKEPRRTMNASECVSRGCAMQCAILSPTFKVREFQVHESFPFSISLAWKGAASDAQNGGAENQQSTIVFPKGNPIPSVKALTFYRSGTFSVDVQYADVSDMQAPSKISTYTIGPFQTSKGERAKLKVKVRLNLHGVVSVESATLLEEEEVEVPVSKEQSEEATKMDTDKAFTEAAPASGDSDVNMQDAKETSDAAGTDNGVPESADKPVQMETDSKAEAPKKKVKKTNVPLSELVYGAMQSLDVEKAVEKEFEMALQDRVMEETKDRKNAVESYVYDMRNKLSDKYQEYITDSEREAFLAKLQEVEDWLYEDGEDETKGVYVAKLEELKKVGGPVEELYKESLERGSVIDQLGYCINSYREAAMSNDPKFDHIELAEKQKVLSECVEAEAWLRGKQQQQDTLPKYATPALLSADVKSKAEALDKFCRPIMTKPKPAKAEAPQAKGGEPADEGKSEPEAGSGEPMETEKPIQGSA